MEIFYLFLISLLLYVTKSGALDSSSQPGQQIKTCSMNVWGLKYITKNKAYRINELSSQFSQSDCDIIALQELFVTKDFEKFEQQLKRTHPHRFWFKSGVVGSGLAIFSKYLIKKAFFQPFRLNGKFRKMFHGDWFASKGIGHAEIYLPQLDLSFNILTTHMIANYQRLLGESDDIYHIQRYSQTYELIDYLNKVSKEELFILLGDFNYNLSSPIFKGIFENTLFAKAQVNWIDFGPTFNLPSSPTYNPSMPQQSIDHIIYGSGYSQDQKPKFHLQAQSASILFANEGLSDHAGIHTTFLMHKKNITSKAPSKPRYKPLCTMLGDLSEEIHKVEKESSSILFHLWMITFILIIMVYFTALNQFVLVNYFIYVGCIVWTFEMLHYHIFMPQERAMLEQFWNEWSLY